MIFATAPIAAVPLDAMLWIAFVPWNYDICNSKEYKINNNIDVVNCFCSLKLWYLQQLLRGLLTVLNCCELLLFLEIMIFATARLWRGSIDYSCELLLFLEIMIFATANFYTNHKLSGCELLLFLEIMIFATAKLTIGEGSTGCELLLFLEIMIFATAYPDLIHWLSIWCKYQ